MTTSHLAEPPSQKAVVDAALLMLRQMGLSPGDLVSVPRERPPVPTFAEYVPVVSAAVTAGTRWAYGSYWNRVLEHWSDRRLDEIAPSEIRQLMSYVKTHVVARRDTRGGRSAAEHLVAALRCLYRHAEDDGLISVADNPARKVAKPRRLPSTRRAVPDTRPSGQGQPVTLTPAQGTAHRLVGDPPRGVDPAGPVHHVSRDRQGSGRPGHGQRPDRDRAGPQSGSHAAGGGDDGSNRQGGHSGRPG